jgi:hypothetical protein
MKYWSSPRAKKISHLRETAAMSTDPEEAARLYRWADELAQMNLFKEQESEDRQIGLFGGDDGTTDTSTRTSTRQDEEDHSKGKG